MTDDAMTDDEARAFIAAHEWRFAKTMPQWPHWYVVRKNCRDAGEFERFVIASRERGYQARFRPHPFHVGFLRPYFEMDGFHYWTMGSPVGETTIINRAPDPNIAEREGA